jgi:hypothetical protein
MAEAEKAVHDIAIMGDNIDFEMDETIIDIEDEAIPKKKTRIDSNKSSSLKETKLKTRRQKIEEKSLKNVDHKTIVLPLTDRNHIDRQKDKITELNSFRDNNSKKQKALKSDKISVKKRSQIPEIYKPSE